MAGTSWYVSNCKDCMNMNLNDRWSQDSSKAWCSEHRAYYDPNDRACSNHFDNDFKRNPGSSEACYLTTIVCDILNFSDDCIYLETLREFRDTVMKPNEALLPILYEYDIVGPVIADKIREDEQKESISKSLLFNHIMPVVEDIQNGYVMTAISKYGVMVNSLKEFYSIDSITYNGEMNVTGKGYLKR